MKKILELIRFLGMIAIVYTSPLVIQEAERRYFQQILPQHVEALTYYGRRYCSGSTIKHGNKSYFVTNRHCCQRGINEETKEPIFATQIETAFNRVRKVLYVSSSHDVCIAESFSSSGLSISTDYEIGDTIRILGFPRGMPFTVRKGTIFDIDSSLFSWLPGPFIRKYLHVSATSYPGNSGSAVVDRLGRVIGLLFAGSPQYPTEGLVVPSEYIVFAIENYERFRR